jgi:hypothetical protein
MISKLVTPPAVISVASPSRSTAACTDGIAAHAVSTERGRGDDAERSFRTDEEIAQVVTGVVLFELVEVVHDAPIGQHHFEAERMRTCDAMGERSRAARIGRKVTADGAASLRGQELRVETVHVRRRLPRLLQCAAGFDNDRVGHRIDFADFVHPV